MTVKQWIIRSVAALVLLLVSSILLLMTPWGTQVALSSAEYLVDGLNIERKQGGLGGQLELSSIEFTQPALTVQVQDTQVNIGWSCLFKLKLCVELFSLDKVTVAVGETEQPQQESEDTPQELITLPLAFELDKFELGSLELTLQDSIKLKVDSVTTQINFYQQLAIEYFTIDQIAVETFESAEPEAVDQSQPFDLSQITQWQYQPIQVPDVYIPIDLQLKQFLLKRFSIINQSSVQKVNNIRLVANVKEHQVGISDLALQYQQLLLNASLEAQLKDNFSHDLIVEVDGELEQQPLLVKLNAKGALDDINLNLTQQGLGQFELSATADVTNEKLPLSLESSWQDIAWPVSTPEIASPTGELLLEGDLSLLSLNSEIHVEAKDQPSLIIEADINTDRKNLDLTKLDVQLLGGSIHNSGTLSIDQQVNWQGETQLLDIDLAQHWPELDALLNGQLATQATLSQDTWQASLSELDIDGEWLGLPLTVNGKASYGNTAGTRLEQLTIINGSNRVLVDATIDLQNMLLAQVNINANDLSDSVPELAGTVLLDADIEGPLAQPFIRFNLDAKDLVTQDISLLSATGNGQLNLNEQKQVDISLFLNEIEQGNTKVDDIQLVLQGDAEFHELEMGLKSQLTNINMRLNGQLSEHSWQGNWLDSEFKFDQFSLQMTESATLLADWKNQHFELSKSCWKTDTDTQESVQDSSVCINQARFAEQLANWDMLITNLPVISLAKLYVPKMDALEDNLRLNANSSVHWTQQEGVNAKFEATLLPSGSDYREPDKPVVVVESLALNGQFSGAKGRFKASLIGPEIGSTEAEVNLQILDQTTEVDGVANIQRFDVAGLKPLVSQIDTLAGIVDGTVDIAGTLSSPQVQGNLTLKDGALASEDLPVELNQLQQSIVFNNTNAEFEGSFLLGGGPGNLTGNISWSPALAGNIHLQGEGLEFEHQNMVRARISPDLKVAFSPTDVDVKGKVVVPYARVKVRELPPSAMSPSSDTQIIEKDELQEQIKLSLDVLVQIDPAGADDVKVDAFGLISDLAGDLRVTQEKKSIIGNGEIRLVNGKFKAYGQDLEIREGDILFNGPIEHPYLSIEAIRNPEQTQDGVIAGIRVTGAAELPKVEIFSEPALDQPESLSYLLQGHGTSGSSGGSGDDNILANMLLNLSVGKSENLVNNVGRKLGVEDLALNTSGAGDETQLQVSGYVAPGVQIRYGVGVFDSVSEVALRYQIWPNFFVEGVSSGVSNALDFFYSFTFDDEKVDANQSQPEEP